MDFEPQVFGDYFLLERIGAGGMAEIFRARRFGAAGFERELALKRVLRRLTDDPKFLQMLTNEAKLTATLQHGNIVQVYDLGLVDGTYFITMEFVEGVSLKQLLRAMAKAGQRFSAVEAAYLAQQIAEGLDYAHRKTDPTGRPLGIVHCDVSPDNILLTRDGQVKIGDFGIARAAASFSNYKEGMVMGKLNYVSPEQARGAVPDRRADIFSTGILLYLLLAGRHPFGQRGSMETLVRIGRLKRGELVSPKAVDPTVPEDLARITMKALEPRPEDRYEYARVMAHELVAYLYPATPIEVQSMVEARIGDLLGEHLEARAKARAADAAVIRRLQRQQAEATPRARSLTQAAADERENAVQGDAASATAFAPGRGRRLFWGVLLGVLAGAGLGAAAMRLGASAPPALLFVDSVPRGAAVRLEHEPLGETPLVHRVPGGRAYLLELDADGYRPVRETFEVDPGALVEKRYALEEERAPLEVLSEPPGAEVYLDGKLAGRTPLTRTLRVGRDVEVAVRRGGATHRQTVTVSEAGLTLRFEFK